MTVSKEKRFWACLKRLQFAEPLLKKTQLSSCFSRERSRNWAKNKVLSQKLRQGQNWLLFARWCEQERATAAQGDAVGVCLKEFTPPPEPLSKGLH